MKPSYPIRRMRDMLASERPQERLESLGADALSESELLAIILRSGPRGIDILTLCNSILQKAGSLDKLLQWNRQDFLGVHGIGKVKAAQLLTIMELTKRLIRAWDEATSTESFDSPERVAQFFRTRVAGLNVDKFWVLCLDHKNRLISDEVITSGTATSSLVHPREVFREAIKCNATAIIGVHNHPSGDPTPSKADIQITRQLRQAAQTLQIDFLDHVILGRREIDPMKLGYYSFDDSGLI
ncbi:MAG: DNA repair protein RadC [Verrucomicrobia bacterium]|nr:DNA repair protein RadC [Verrucomicrobiota bacterium]